jgi:putative ABC transport system permease protein
MLSPSWIWPQATIRELRSVLRSLARSPGLAASVVGTLFLGIGTGTLVFVLTGWVTLRSLPYPHPDQLVTVGMQNRQKVSTNGVYPFQYEGYRGRTDLFSEYGATAREWDSVTVDGEPVSATVAMISKGFFPTLGIHPALGRGFAPSEFQPTAGDVAVISDLFWRRQFGGDPSVLGKTVVVGREPCVVVGVLRVDQLVLRQSFDIYRPREFAYDPAKPFDLWMQVVARLKEGISPRQARDSMAASPPTPPSYAWPSIGLDPQLTPVRDSYRSGPYWLMLGAGAFLYIIAILNAANLMLVRATRRGREWSIRYAVGASRWQIVRPVITESSVLALAAGLAVALVARISFPPLVVMIARSPDAAYESYWDAGTLGWIAGLSVIAAVAVSVLPVARLFRQNIQRGLSEGGLAAGESPRVRRARNTLVVIQASLALVLITGAGLMVETFHRLQGVRIGFEPHRVVTAWISSPPYKPDEPERRRQLFQGLRERILNLPGVTDVSYGSGILLNGGFYSTDQVAAADGATPIPVQLDYVSEDLPRVAGLNIIRGRWIDDRPSAVRTAVINESLSRARFGRQDPVGQFIMLLQGGQRVPIEVVGVIADIRESLRAGAGMNVYVPETKAPLSLTTLVIRLSREPDLSFGSRVRRAVYQLDPRLVVNVQPMDQRMANMAYVERYVSTVLSGLAVIALVLAAMGLFSALACTVDQRMREFGVRMALGATSGQILGFVIRGGLTLAALGVGIGAACSLGLTRLLQSLLFDTAPYDPAIYVGAGTLLIGVAAVACWLPARRAAAAEIVRLFKSE